MFCRGQQHPFEGKALNILCNTCHNINGLQNNRFCIQCPVVLKQINSDLRLQQPVLTKYSERSCKFIKTMRMQSLIKLYVPGTRLFFKSQELFSVESRREDHLLTFLKIQIEFADKKNKNENFASVSANDSCWDIWENY